MTSEAGCRPGLPPPTDGFNRAVVKRNTALIPLFKQNSAPVVQSPHVAAMVFQTAEITAVAALMAQLHLNMPNFADVAVTANEDASVGDNRRLYHDERAPESSPHQS